MLRSSLLFAAALLPACSLLFDAAAPNVSDDGGVSAIDGGDMSVDASTSTDGNGVVVWSGSFANHTCASKGAQVVCWGDNSSGQLGTGDRDAHNDVSLLTPFTLPSAENPSFVVELALGLGHTCALLNNGGVYCWGRNDQGQLGLGDTLDRNAPLSIRIPLAKNASSQSLLAYRITAGDDHNCAIIEGDKMQCWGNVKDLMDSFAIDDLDTIWGDDEFPDEKPTIPIGFPLRAFDIGGTHGCAVEAQGGADRVQCWGTMIDGGANALDPPISYPSEPYQVVSGGFFSCVRGSEGKIRCWGNNAKGQCGQNNGGAFIPLPPADGLEFDSPLQTFQLLAGARHTCSVMYGGALRCWGEGLRGALGQGSTDNIGLSANLRFATTQVPIGTDVMNAAAGQDHTCAVLGSGGIRCWGSNQFGQLGTGQSCEELAGSANPADGLCNFGDDANELPSTAIELNIF